jgi:hypothetical protein
MIEVYIMPQTLVGLFENYNELFEFICETENQKLSESHLKYGGGWSFVLYSPDRVAFLYNDRKRGLFAPKVNPNIKEAYEQQVSLVEICTGDYKHPEYIVVTPNVNMQYLKKKWCIDYCTFYNFVVRDSFETEIIPP